MAGKKKAAGVHVSWPKPSFAETIKTNKKFTRYFNAAMLYAQYELSAIELKREVVKYLKSQDVKHPFIERIKDINDNRFTTVGKYMYILNHGADIPDDIFSKLMPALEKVIEEEETKLAAQEKDAAFKNSRKLEQISVSVSVPTIQDRLREKAREVAGEIEGWIDDFCMDKKISIKTVEEFVNLFRANNLKAPHMRHMRNIFERRATEIDLATSGTDKDLNEAYSNYTKQELKKLDLFHKNLLKGCEMLQEVAKVTRAVRKKKPVPKDKMVAKLKYKKEDNTLGIVSMNPIQIPGSKEMWVYNTKTRKLGQYKAIDIDGISVKGAGLVNYSSESVEKTLRKPAEQLAEFKKASKVKLRTFLTEINAVDTKLNGKLNENHIILRIDK